MKPSGGQVKTNERSYFFSAHNKTVDAFLLQEAKDAKNVQGFKNE